MEAVRHNVVSCAAIFAAVAGFSCSASGQTGISTGVFGPPDGSKPMGPVKEPPKNVTYLFDWQRSVDPAPGGILDDGGRYERIQASYNTTSHRLTFALTTSSHLRTSLPGFDYGGDVLQQVLDRGVMPRATEGYTMVTSPGGAPASIGEANWGQAAQYYFDGYQPGIDNLGEVNGPVGSTNTLQSYMDAAGVSYVPGGPNNASGSFTTHNGDGNVSAYGYNGRTLRARTNEWHPHDGWQDGAVLVNPDPSQPNHDPNFPVGYDLTGGDQSPDRIIPKDEFQADVTTDVSFAFGSHQFGGQWVDVNLSRTMSFEVDASDILSWEKEGNLLNPHPDGNPWFGTGFGDEIGLWIQTFKQVRERIGLNDREGVYAWATGPEYDDEGFLSKWATSGPSPDYPNEAGWAGFWDGFGFETTKVVPAPGTAGLLACTGVFALRRRR